MRLYGLDVAGLPGKIPLLSVSRAWHRLSIVRTNGPAPVQTFVEVAAEHAHLSAAGELALRVRRDETDAYLLEIRAPRPVPDHELVHPLMSFVGAVVAQWRGRWAFHAAAVVLEDRVWLLLAPPEGGKSTLAAVLAQRGHPVLSVDLAVIEDRTVFSGPQACDLRPASAVWLGQGERLVGPGTRGERWRTTLPPAPLEAPLGGFIVLGWGSLAVRSLAAAERVQALGAHRALGLEPERGVGLLDLLDLPGYSVTRPRDFAQMQSTIEAIESCAVSG